MSRSRAIALAVGFTPALGLVAAQPVLAKEYDTLTPMDAGSTACTGSISMKNISGVVTATVNASCDEGKASLVWVELSPPTGDPLRNAAPFGSFGARRQATATTAGHAVAKGTYTATGRVYNASGGIVASNFITHQYK